MPRLVRAGTLACMSTTGRKLQMAGQVMLAGGFVLSALAIWKNAEDEGGLRGLGEASGSKLPSNKVLHLPKAKLPASVEAAKALAKPKLKSYDITDIDSRVGLIGELIRKGSLSADLRERTVELLSQKCDASGRITPNGDRWCVREKDCLGEVKAIFEAVRVPRSKYAVRYTRDAMLADVFTAPERTLLKSHGGDCDDYVIVLGSMLMAVGHPVRMRVVATQVPGEPPEKCPWSHIYLLTPTTFDNPKATWISVDGSMDRPLGWEAPGAKEVARTGKPAGIIARVRDYTLMKPNETA